MAEKKKKSYREQNHDNSRRKAKGQPRAWTTEKQFYDDLQEFVDHVKHTDYTILPTLSSFRLWLKDYKDKPVDIGTITLTLNDYYSDYKNNWYQMLSDTLTEGAALGHYQPATTIFALKNWCKWTDKQEVVADTTIRIELDASLQDWAK